MRKGPRQLLLALAVLGIAFLMLKNALFGGDTSLDAAVADAPFIKMGAAAALFGVFTLLRGLVNICRGV